MAKGDGSIQKRGKNAYLVQISYGKDAATGKYRRVSRVVHGTKAEAQRVRDEMIRERDRGLVFDANKMTFKSFAQLFLEMRAASGEVGLEYIEQLDIRLKCLYRYIGDMKLKEITPQVIETTLVAVKKDKIEERGRFSNSTLKSYHETLSVVFSKALDYDYVLKNPCVRAAPPKRGDSEKRVLKESEAAKFLELIDAHEVEAYARLEEIEENRSRLGRADWLRTRNQFLTSVSFVAAVRIALMTGARIGEILALDWNAVDFEEGTVAIRRSLAKKSGLKAPKTRSSNRILALDSKTIDHLSEWKSEQARYLSLIGVEACDETPVVCNGYGEHYKYNTLHRQFKKFCINAGFAGLTLHCLRHTQATLLAENGASPRAIQERLGHSSYSTTLSIYSHVLPETERKSAELMASICNSEEA